VRSTLFTAVLLAACAAGLSRAAHAEELLRVRMTHDFSVGKTAFPAGTYVVRRLGSAASDELIIQSEDGKSSALILPVSREANESGVSQLSFLRGGDVYQLREIDTWAGVYTVAPGQGRHADKMAPSSSGPGQ